MRSSSSNSASTSGPLIARTLAPVGAFATPGVDFEFGDLTAERRLAARGAAWRQLVGTGAGYFYFDQFGARDGLNISPGMWVLRSGNRPTMQG